MNRLILGTALALATSVGLAAQQSTTKTQTKVDVKDGKNVTVTGCVDRAASGQGFVLTRVESGGTPSPFYALVGEDAALSSHVGHLVEIRGKATDVGDDGKVGRDHEDEGRTRARRRHAREDEDADRRDDRRAVPWREVREDAARQLLVGSEAFDHPDVARLRQAEHRQAPPVVRRNAPERGVRVLAEPREAIR